MYASKMLYSLNKLHTALCKSIRLLKYFGSNNSSYQDHCSKTWRVVFYGSDNFSIVTLKALEANWIGPRKDKVVEMLEVVCVQAECPVRKYATTQNLKIHTWPYEIPKDTYDVGIVASFGHMVPSKDIEACKYGMINAHPSLLPRWRGSSPIFYSILKGDEETGVTITQVSPNKFDVGNILMQKKYRIPPDATTGLMDEVLSKKSADMIMETLRSLLYYLKNSYPQSKEGITNAYKIKAHHLVINWESDTVVTIDRKVRAFKGFFELHTFMKEMKVSILDCVTPDEVQNANIDSLVDAVSPGFCYFHKRRKVLFVKCKDGWCGVTLLKTPISGKITALQFHNGYLSRVDEKERYFISHVKTACK